MKRIEIPIKDATYQAMTELCNETSFVIEGHSLILWPNYWDDKISDFLKRYGNEGKFVFKPNTSEFPSYPEFIVKDNPKFNKHQTQENENKNSWIQSGNTLD